MRILVTGGAGYVGSHTVRYLNESGADVTVLDNFSTGHHWAVNGIKLIEADLLDASELESAFRVCNFDAVIHFAAKSIVSESELSPIEYFKNNVSGSINLCEAMLESDVKNIVFSSTAAVYGEPNQEFIAENHPLSPINIYGQTKLAIENMLQELYRSKGLRSVSLRYFNAAGAEPTGGIGEAHPCETHLIPNVINGILSGANDEISIFGNDYPTRDGTCIRDYVHVNDLASAHCLSLEHLLDSNICEQYNLGSGLGCSVLEIVKAIEDVSKLPIEFSFKDRRQGDPACLVADINKVKSDLNWEPIHSSINEIIADAYRWHQSRFVCR